MTHRFGAALRALGGVGTAVLISSALGYLLLFGYGRYLVSSPVELETLLVFWSVLLGTGAALGPIEQDIARQATQAAVHGRRPGRGVYQVAVVGLVAVLVAGALALVPPLPRMLFGSHPELLAVAVAGGLACCGHLTVRGLLLGRHRIASYGGLLVAENAVRVVLLGALILAAVRDLLPLAVTAAAGYAVWLVVVPARRNLVEPKTPGQPWPAVTRRVLALMASAALMASVLTGFPALVGALAPVEADGDLAALFLALQVARIPLLLLSPVQALTVPVVVRMSQDERGRRRLRGLLVRLVIVTIAAGAAGAAAGAVAGPAAVTLLFGPEYRIGHLAMAALVWSSVALGAVVLLSAVLIAKSMAGHVVTVWAAVAGISALALVLGPWEMAERAVVGIAVAPAFGLAIATVAVLRGQPVPSAAQQLAGREHESA